MRYVLSLTLHSKLSFAHLGQNMLAYGDGGGGLFCLRNQTKKIHLCQFESNHIRRFAHLLNTLGAQGGVLSLFLR